MWGWYQLDTSIIGLNVGTRWACSPIIEHEWREVWAIEGDLSPDYWSHLSHSGSCSKMLMSMWGHYEVPTCWDRLLTSHWHQYRSARVLVRLWGDITWACSCDITDQTHQHPILRWIIGIHLTIILLAGWWWWVDINDPHDETPRSGPRSGSWAWGFII